MSRMRGFTLIEILIVMIVVAILMGVVVAAFSGVDREQTLNGYAHRLALRIELARDKAIQRNREWGMYIERDGIEFAEFDAVNRLWSSRMEKPFAPEAFAGEVYFKVTVEDGLLPLSSQDEEFGADEEDTRMPHVILFSSGEVTPFTIEIEPRTGLGSVWQLVSDGFTRTEAARPEHG